MAIQAQLCSENLGFPSCGAQDWIMENGCGGFGGFNGFSLNLQQKQQLQQQQQHVQQLQYQQQRNQNLFFDNSFIASTLKNNTSATDNSHIHDLPMLYSQGSIASQFEKQRQEIDQYIRLQNERLRLVLQEQRKQQLAQLLKKIESKTLLFLRQKDEEIAQAAKRTMELEDFLRRLEAENQAWQRVAQENEAMVVSLNNTLEQVKETAPCGFNNGADDAESCCDDNDREQEEAEENRRGLLCEVEQRNMMMVCKGCNFRSSCMLFLPCRHLCSCKACEAFLDSCPVCTTAKKASIEALIF
ncbi:probable BOI-related E3 ubiquitin-protein ligase 3 isoform X2 [Corylus avellana]|uniref:probable BOI-related E3 ubiquitin-protein ligase 3 isoform X2 n=1 Tax=Corylus avellana TaxID=13451 RepID=UPI001E1F627E|nr:probable BOI-related E3 ubiquitin-protein ligase 3 isoform X2 [Corylus avellana]